jgi:hypothetical protein
MTDEQVKQLIEQQQTIIEKISKSKGKDNWDKLATLSTFLSTIVIGVIGIYFTYAYKSQEFASARCRLLRNSCRPLPEPMSKQKRGH